MLSLFYVSFLLIAAIAAIILLSARWKFNTFFTLLLVATVIGFAIGLDGEKLVAALKKGFGATLEKVGLLVILGTALGLMLDKTRATLSLANFILRKTGEKNATWAVMLMGFLIGLPIFCDAGFIVLIGLVLSLARRQKGAQVLLVTILATALFGVHCLVPPHPGISAAAGILKVDLGKAMLLGSLLAIPPTVVAFFWLKKQAQNLPDIFSELIEKQSVVTENLPNPFRAILPIIVPILLIAVKSILLLNPAIYPPSVLSLVKFMGEPIVALFIGILLTLPLFQKLEKQELNDLLGSAIEKSGHILAIIAMGGAFGEIIKQMDLGQVFGANFAASGLRLFIPFALTAIFKTAQGSSTVAVMSVAGIIEPLLPALGLDTEGGRLLSLMAAGAGSMTVSHVNDAYFWVVHNFGELDSRTTLRYYSMATALMGAVAFLCIWLIAQI